jgi:excisionase family DNA binding protein
MSTLLTVQETASRLRISKAAVRSLVKAGRLRPVRLLGRKLLFTERCLEEAIRGAMNGCGCPDVRPARRHR